jgi:DNA (cytosine-5)-methyltransferase 1
MQRKKIENENESRSKKDKLICKKKEMSSTDNKKNAICDSDSENDIKVKSRKTIKKIVKDDSDSENDIKVKSKKNVKSKKTIKKIVKDDSDSENDEKDDKNNDKKSLNVLDLFCGCGGMTTGLVNAGLNIVAGIDIWDKAIESYSSNHDHLSICADLTKLSPEDFKRKYNITSDIDVIVGGPPCQGFSIAGKRDQKDPRNSLFMEYCKYLDFFKPKAFIMENVIGILSMKTENGENVIDIVTEHLGKNYNYKINKLYASDFEVPQNRRRTIIVGIRKDLKIIPKEIKPILSKEDRIAVSTILEDEDDVDEKYFLSERAINGINAKKERSKLNGKGFGAQFLKLDEPSYTIPARYWKDGYDALVKYDDDRIRRLTISELKKIQSFPDNYVLKGNNKEIIMQIGNAVACRFAYHLGKYITKILQ